MPINPITNVTHFPVEQASHSSEEKRKRDQKGETDENDNGEYKKQQAKAQENCSLPASNEEAALSSQYVDTPAVIDLLSHRPTVKPTEKNPFNHIKNLTALTVDKNRKKINKSF